MYQCDMCYMGSQVCDCCGFVFFSYFLAYDCILHMYFIIFLYFINYYYYFFFFFYNASWRCTFVLCVSKVKWYSRNNVAKKLVHTHQTLLTKSQTSILFFLVTMSFPWIPSKREVQEAYVKCDINKHSILSLFPL